MNHMTCYMYETGVYGDPKQPVGEDEYQTLLDTALELGDTFIDSAGPFPCRVFARLISRRIVSACDPNIMGCGYICRLAILK